MALLAACDATCAASTKQPEPGLRRRINCRSAGFRSLPTMEPSQLEPSQPGQAGPGAVVSLRTRRWRCTGRPQLGLEFNLPDGEDGAAVNASTEVRHRRMPYLAGATPPFSHDLSINHSPQPAPEAATDLTPPCPSLPVSGPTMEAGGSGRDLDCHDGAWTQRDSLR